MVSLPKEFRARLESYSGPLDLLLYLIKKDEIDIFDIPIAQVTDQYQTYLEILKNVDPNACGEFLVMAARLMEIKSKLLIPREILEEEGEELEDPRIELVRQLLEYKKYKERAILLEKRLDLYRKRHNRPSVAAPGAAEDEDEVPLMLGNVSVWDLLTAFHGIEIALGQRMPHQIVIEDRPLEDYVREVILQLENAPNATVIFSDIFLDAGDRSEAIGYFLAILELAKDHRISLHQEDDLGTIYLGLRNDDEAQIREQESGEEYPDENLGPGDLHERDRTKALDDQKRGESEQDS